MNAIDTVPEIHHICASIIDRSYNGQEIERIEAAIANFRRAEFGLRPKNNTVVEPIVTAHRHGHYFVPGDKAKIQQPANYAPKYLNGLNVVVIKRRITNLLVKLDPPRGCRYDTFIINPEHLVHQP